MGSHNSEMVPRTPLNSPRSLAEITADAPPDNPLLPDLDSNSALADTSCRVVSCNLTSMALRSLFRFVSFVCIDLISFANLVRSLSGCVFPISSPKIARSSIFNLASSTASFAPSTWPVIISSFVSNLP